MTGPSYAVVPRGYLSMGIAYTITMHALICPASCKHHFSSATWLVFAMASSSCLELLASVLHSFLFVIYIDQLNVSRWCNFDVVTNVFCSVGLVDSDVLCIVTIPDFIQEKEFVILYTDLSLTIFMCVPSLSSSTPSLTSSFCVFEVKE